ncbi:MAG: tRNA (adenosine(37)-N6)-dimethylallyltransferase MiaA [Clostridiales bacterium]|nr:tRNA (adenosine(37)-N6)-dimethylallyltransferase MiaA [Clostridiales bacterium]
MDKNSIIIVLGPTAVGKTSISIDLAKELHGEIISADSMQIYKYMDIGTAKPNMEERQGIPHHLLDILDPSEYFNVSIYKDMAEEEIKEIVTRGKIPIIVGGTGLYINSLLFPFDFTEAGVDLEYRQNLKELALIKGKEWLYGQLKTVDPIAALKLHPNDIFRIIRALEVHHITGEPISKYYSKQQRKNGEYSASIVGLTMDRDKLYDRIEKRIDIMLKNGLVEEVKGLLENGYSRGLISMQGLGYKEIVDYLQGRRTLKESEYILKRDTRRFAKRQYTWFKRLKGIIWVDVGEFNNKKDLLAHVLDKLA